MVNCCNFGNPEKPESYWYFSQAVKGMADFCKKMRIPVVGGNVSFYNEDEVTNTAIKPTPTIMIVGLIKGKENIITLPFKEPGNEILLIGETKAELGGSEYHSVIHNIEGGSPPEIEEEIIKARWNFIKDLYGEKLIKANHDVNKGGFLITVAEMCFKNNLGAHLNIKNYAKESLREDEFLFSETAGRFIIESNPEDYDRIMEKAISHQVEVKKIGVISSEPKLKIINFKGKQIIIDLGKMKDAYNSTIPNMMEI